MRLFIALNFGDETKNKLLETQNRLKSFAKSGNFTRAENLHVTLVFIGEAGERERRRILSVIDGLDAHGFSLTFSGFGSFGSLYWMGIKRSQPLDALYEKLCLGLSREGFKIEKRGFKPHITLAREVVFPPAFDRTALAWDIPEITEQIRRISLMKSERANGKLIYTEVYGKNLSVS